MLSRTLYDGLFRKVGEENITTGMTSFDYEPSPIPRSSSVSDAVSNTIKTRHIASNQNGLFEAKEITDPNGHVSFSHLDGLGRERVKISPIDGKTYSTYDEYSRLKTVYTITSTGNNTFEYSYNEMDLVDTTKIPGTIGVYKNEYDARYRLRSTKDPNGNTFNMSYDDLNRVTGVTLGDPSGGIIQELLLNTYPSGKTWLTGSIVKLLGDGISGTKEVKIHRDAFGRVEGVDEIISDIGSNSIKTTLNDAGMPKDMTQSITGPQSMSYGYIFGYDNVLRPVQTTLNNDEIISFLKYNQQDLVQTKFLGGKMDYSGEIQAIDMAGFLQKVDYRYDAAGKLLEINTAAESECTQEEEICMLEAKFSYIYRKNLYEKDAEESIKFDECGRKLMKILVNGQAFDVNGSFIFGVNHLSVLQTLIEQALDSYGQNGSVQVFSSIVQGPGGWNSMLEYTIQIGNTSVETLVLEMAPNSSGLVCKHEFLKKDCCKVSMPIGPGSMGMNNPFTTSNYDLFTEKLKYDHWDIERIDYGSDCISGGMRNEYKYDANHRLINVNNTMFKNGVKTQGVYSEQFTYANVIGDLGSLTRSSTVLAGVANPLVPYQPAEIDKLTYKYYNGRLQHIIEEGNQQRGFKGANTTFTYDKNGNMLTDLTKGLTFEYNIINLPKKIIGAGGSMTNVYAFSGEKVMSVNALGQKRVYLGGMEYLAGAKQHYAHPEGRIVYEVENNEEKDFIQYKITDHLGNLMVLFGDRNGDRKINTETDVAAADDGNPTTPPTVQLEIVQRHFYYAYGMEMEGPWQHMPTMRDAYMYNGKELLEDLGMNLSDYGARYYDAVIGRWTGVDPLAEEYYGWSPYNYVLENPIGLIDPTGMSVEGGPGGPSNRRGPLSTDEEDRVLSEVVITGKDPGPRPERENAPIECQSCSRATIDSRNVGLVVHNTVREGANRSIGKLDWIGDRVDPFVGVTAIYVAEKIKDRLLYHSYTIGEGFENSLKRVPPVKTFLGKINTANVAKFAGVLSKVGVGLQLISAASYANDIRNGEKEKGWVGLAIMGGSIVAITLCPPCTLAVIAANAVYSLKVEDELFKPKKQ